MNGRRQFGRGAELWPDSPTPCFCSSCMAAGGAARERLRAKWFNATRRWVMRNEKSERQKSLARAARARKAAAS